MKILICGSRGIPARYGGFETLVEGIVSEVQGSDKEIVVTGFSTEISESIRQAQNGVVSYQVRARGPRNLHNLVSTWLATRQMNREHQFDAVLVLNEVNFLVARKYWKLGIPTVLHLDGSNEVRSGLTFFAKVAHSFFRYLALKSKISLVTDSEDIRSNLSKINDRVSLITYAPHLDRPIQFKLEGKELIADQFLLVVARFVRENQLIQIINSFLESERNERLIVVGLGTGSKKYESEVLKLAQTHRDISILAKNYNRGEINWLLQNAKAYIHGHTVGGTNPILVDARFHSHLILGHENPYNKESSGPKEFFWRNPNELTQLLRNLDNIESAEDAIESYSFLSWKQIAKDYLGLLGHKC